MPYRVGQGPSSASGRRRRLALIAGALTALVATGCGQNRPAEALRTSSVSGTTGDHTPTGPPDRLALKPGGAQTCGVTSGELSAEALADLMAARGHRELNVAGDTAFLGIIDCDVAVVGCLHGADMDFERVDVTQAADEVVVTIVMHRKPTGDGVFAILLHGRELVQLEEPVGERRVLTRMTVDS